MDTNKTNAQIQKTKLKTKKNMTNLDIFVIADELNDYLSDGFIDNIYEINNNNLLQFKCRTKKGKVNIIIDASKRINISNYSYPIPEFPSQYCSSLRKYIKGRRILKVYQYEHDRIIIFELFNKEGEPWKFIIEFFLGGNFILVDDQNRVFMAKNYKISKDRKLLAKKPYIFPEKRGINFLNSSNEEILDMLSKFDIEIVRNLARNLGIPGYIAEEICLRANIDKKKPFSQLNDLEIKNLMENINLISDMVKNKPRKNILYSDDNNNFIAFEPFPLLQYDSYNKKEFSTFNEAVDEYFAKIDSELLTSGSINKANKALAKYKRIYESQKEQIKESEINREKHLELGNLLYQHFSEVDSLLKTIYEARKKDYSWEDIVEKMKKGKEMGIKEALIFEKPYPKEAKIGVNLDGNLLKLDFRKTVVENAEEIYKKAKKDKRRIIGAQEALKKTEKTLKEKEFEHEMAHEQNIPLIKRPKKNWYEKFRWFISSDGFLVVGGKDASSNETLGKKYMEKNDLFFHTELRGAPVVILKNPDNLPIPELTIKEAATFAASYSNAWREGWSSGLKIFYVHPDQVSKSPNPGEYLTKGAFFIKGTKNFLEKPFLELAIGLVLEEVGESEDIDEGEDSSIKGENSNKENNQNSEITPEEWKEQTASVKKIYYPRIIAGPFSAISIKTKILVRIKPQKSSKLGGGKLAKKIKALFIEKMDEPLKKWARAISENDIIHFLPPGGSSISSK